MNLETETIYLYSGMSAKTQRKCWIVGNIVISGNDSRYQLYHRHTGLGITMNYAIDKKTAALAAMELQLLPCAWESNNENVIASSAMVIGQNIFREVMRSNGMKES